MGGPSDTGFNLFLLAIVCAGLAMIILEFRRARSVRTWPRTSGRVTASRVTTMDAYAADAYGCVVDYEYMVDGSSYTGTEQLIGFQTPDRTRAQELCKKYKAGDELLIAYNQAYKSESLLVGVGTEVGVGTILVGAAMAALALAWLLHNLL